MRLSYNPCIYLNYSLLGLDAQSLPAYSPKVEMLRGRAYQINIAIDARAGVPARVGAKAVVDTHAEHVLALLEIRGQLIHKGDVAVGAPAQQMAVQVHLAAVVNSFEIYEVLLGAIIDSKVLAVPAYASGKISGAAGKIRTHQTFDGPVVGQVDTSPAGVVIVCKRHFGRVGEAEFPAGIELGPFSKALTEGRSAKKQGKQTDQGGFEFRHRW